MVLEILDNASHFVCRFIGLDSYSALEERRPSFPQGGLDWRLRRRSGHQERSRPANKKNSFGREHQLWDGPDKEEEGGNLFPESLPEADVVQCACPMIRVDNGSCPPEVVDTPSARSAVPGGGGGGGDADSNHTTPSINSRKNSQCSCPGCPVSISISGSNNNGRNGDGHPPGGGRGSCQHDGRACLWRSSKETVIINVGGQVFETYRTTLKRLKTPIFNCEETFKLYFRKTHGDYFFDRDPTAFGSVLNFLRTGELHIPTNMCGPALQNELEFWGIEELDIARCCWTQYNTWKTQCRSLEKLEYDRKFSTAQQANPVRHDSSSWVKLRSSVWTFLQDPGSSRKAKVYAWVSIIFVFISIFSFCAETHPLFKVKARDMAEYRSMYQYLHLGKVEWELLKHCYSNDSAIKNDTLDKACEMDLPQPTLLLLDVSCLMFFSLEYLLRFICSPNKLDFVRALQNIVDFLAFAPDYVELVILILDTGQSEGASIMEMFFILRILRLFRIFRLIRHVPGLWILLYTLKASFNELMLMCVFLLIGMVVFATLIHFVEPHGEFNNIPVGFWWSVVTMTTVGYGDMSPESAGGYVIGSCCAVAGLLMIAFTVPIIVSNFVLYYTHVQYGLARKDREAEKQRLLEEEERLGTGTGTGNDGHEDDDEDDEEEDEGDEEEEDGEEEEEERGGGVVRFGGVVTMSDKPPGIRRNSHDIKEVSKAEKRKMRKRLGGGKVNVKDNLENSPRRSFNKGKMAALEVEIPTLTTTKNGNSYHGVRNSDAMEMKGSHSDS